MADQTIRSKGLKFDWNGPSFKNACREQLKERLALLGEELKRRVQRNIGRFHAPPHSVSGEYPHMVSHRLVKSIFWRFADGGKSVIVAAPSNLPYALLLETTMHRSFLRRTLLENTTYIRSVMARKFQDDFFKKQLYVAGTGAKFNDAGGTGMRTFKFDFNDF